MKSRVFDTRAARATCVLLAALTIAAPASAQERRGFVYGSLGGASIGHADSEQGRAPIYGGGVAFQVASPLVIELDVHRASVEQVFGREQHDFTQLTVTGSLLFRAPLAEKADFLAGGGLGFQRAHTDFTLDPFGRVDRTERIRLLHGKAGLQWDLLDDWAMRAEGVLWMGSGLDWVAGGRVLLGYRF